MKLTKDTLKKMIHEELEALGEYGYPDFDKFMQDKETQAASPAPMNNPPSSDKDKKRAMKMIDMLFMNGMDYNEIVQKVKKKYPNLDRIENMVSATMMRM